MKKTTAGTYLDGFVHPIPRKYLDEYRKSASQVAAIWKEYGALEYREFVCDHEHLEGTRSFTEAAGAAEEEVVLFGWVVFPNKEARDKANAQVPQDPRMEAIVAPLLQPNRKIFDAARMVYGGFTPLV